MPPDSNSNFTTKNTKSTKGKIRKDFNYLLFLYFIFVSFVFFVVQNPKSELLPRGRAKRVRQHAD